MANISTEQQRLNDNAAKEIPLEKWGPYLSEREWGTVREDYSEGGDAWNYFPHDHARSRTYLWGEDGLAGIADRMQNICFAVALWNGKDAILKERLFGLANGEGNHGEDVKELYYYLDNVPSHYYMRYLYKYPQAAFPYNELINTNAALSKQDAEYEILDTGVFNEDKYFDVFVTYAKQDSEDIFIKIEIINRSSETAPITVLPIIWFYNRWQYGGFKDKPLMQLVNENTVALQHERLNDYFLYFNNANDVLFTENETNVEKLYGRPNHTAFVKDAFHDAIIEQKNMEALRQNKQGTKCSPVYHYTIGGGKTETLYLRLSNKKMDTPFDENIESIFTKRKQEADEFYASLSVQQKDDALATIQRQALSGLLWNKQYYHFDVERWLSKTDGITPTTEQRCEGRNAGWKNLKSQDIISMPDKWEYPWFAAWDSAFHAISMALVDPVFAKNQLILLMREWYMNAEGQLPAYEWNFSDVNPPVHAFAALEVYQIDKNKTGKGDINFLKKIFQKLIINFTWWVNRKDENGNNIFEGGFLGLDNISIFNRNANLGTGVVLEQTDGTSWMGMYALNMMDIAMEIAMEDEAFEDAATKFYEHFVIIASALNTLGLWNEEDNFFYDVLSRNGKEIAPLKVRTIVGLIPLFAVAVINKQQLNTLNDFKKRMDWFKDYRISNKKYLPSEAHSENDSILLTLVHKERLVLMLQRFLDENEFLSNAGIRSLSKHYAEHPYSIELGGQQYTINYDPADSTSGMYGGNSNWRGPVWMPINYLFIKALRKYGSFYGDSLKVAFPTGSGNLLNLQQVANELADRLVSIFKKDAKGNIPAHGKYNWFYKDKPELLQFYEYFHGDDGHGLGASHQTGWTALVANLMETTTA